MEQMMFHRTRSSGNTQIPFDTNDDAIVQFIISENKLFIMNMQLYIYLNGVYVFDKNFIIVKSLIGACIFQEFKTAFRIERILKLLKSELSIQREYEDINQFPRTWINFQNGMLDVLTLKMHPHSPDYYSINQLPHEWNPSMCIDNSIAKQFIESLIPDSDDLQMFLEYSGYCFTTDTRFQKMLYVKGKGGIGKSELLRLVEMAVGKDNVSALTIQNLNERFSPIFLLGKILNVYADVSSEEMNDTAGLKTITGEDLVRAEYKGGDVVFFHPYCKLLFSANRIPHAQDDRTNAYYRRLMILQIDHRADEIDNLSVKLHDDIDSFIYMAVMALHDAYERNELIESDNSKSAIVRLQMDSDSVMSFLYDSIVKADDNHRIMRKKMYGAYSRYCDDNERPKKAPTGFYASLRDKGYTERKSDGIYYFIGVQFIDESKFIPVDS